MSESKTNTQLEFHVSRGEETLGPWTLNEIATRLAKSEIAVTDFLYDETRGDWVPLLEYAPLKELLRASKPKKAPPSARSDKTTGNATSDEPQPSESEMAAPRTSSMNLGSDHDSAEWFVQKGSHRYGPFTYLGLIRALQEKSVFEFDYIWKNGMDHWVRLAEHEEFHQDRIRDLKQKETGGQGAVFMKRKHPRIPFEGEVLVHDNRTVWVGKAFEGSAGGSGVVIENATLVPGQVILLHFAPTDGLPAFNALCEIVSKKFCKDIRDTKSPVSYGVRFIKLDSSVESKVQEFFSVKGGENPVPSQKAAA